MSTLQQQTRAVVGRIKQAILDLGGAASIAQIATQAGLPATVVSRRLTSNTSGNSTPAFAWFAKTADGWTLTQRGMEAL